MSKREVKEAKAAKKREREAKKLTELGRESGCLFVKRLKKLNDLDRISNDHLARLLSLTTVDALPETLAEYLIRERNFARCLTNSVRSKMTRQKLDWRNERFVAAFLDGLLHQHALESRRLAGEADKNVVRELTKKNTPAPEQRGPRLDRAYPEYVPPGPAIRSHLCSTQGNSMLGLILDLRHDRLREAAKHREQN